MFSEKIGSIYYLNVKTLDETFKGKDSSNTAHFTFSDFFYHLSTFTVSLLCIE